MRFIHSLMRSGFAIGIVLATWGAARGDDVTTELKRHLNRGDLSAAQAGLDKVLQTNPDHQQARFGLGVVHVLKAIEGLAQDQYRYGALTQYVSMVPGLRLPVPVNEEPQEITYEQSRQIFAEFQERLNTAETVLAKVDVGQDVKLPLKLDEVRLDLTGDGMAAENETLMHLFGAVNRFRNGQQPEMDIAFDAGDVAWLRGYCHFLSAFCDVLLAYDGQRLFDVCGHLVYPRAVPSDPAIRQLDGDALRIEDRFMDFIAAIHLIDFPIQNAERMKSAHGHLMSMIRLSRQSWDLILAETDNDREWLPNPEQTGILGIPVSRQMIDSWRDALTEMEDLLEGRKLIPFWRDYVRFNGNEAKVPAAGRGINLKKFFYEPRDFDLVLTVQGTGVLPYLEQGPLSRPETWSQLAGVFRGRFFGFAMWFN